MYKSSNKYIQNNTIGQGHDNIPNSPKFELGSFNVTAIVGAILLAIFVYRLNRRLQIKRTFSIASEEYRTAFIPIKKFLEDEEISDREIVSATFDEIMTATIKFKGYLHGTAINRFEKDWNEYKKHYKDRVDVPLFEMLGTEALDINLISDSAHHKEVAIMRRKQIKEHIDTLLSYTSIK